MVLEIDTLPGAMLRVDADAKICELNEACQDLESGFNEGDNLGGYLDAAGREALQRCLSSQRNPLLSCREFEACIDRRRLRLSVAGNSCADGSRFVQITDITDYRALSEQIAINEQRYRSLFSQNSDAVCSMDRDGCIVESNPCTERLTGYNQKQLRAHRWESLVEKSDREAAKVSFGAAVKGRPCSYRCIVRNRDGHGAVVHMTYIPIVVDEKVVGVFAIAGDKTERYQMEEERRLLQTCMAHVTDVIIITETDPLDEPGPRIIYVNDGVERMTGYRPQEVMGQTPRLFQGPDTDRAALDRIRRALEARQPIKEVVVNYCKDGQPFWNELEIVPIPAFGNGERAYFASVQRDITQTKQREAELRRSREELRRLNRAQEEILEQERRRIARDLHDELGQTLTALKLSLGVAVEDVRTVLPEPSVGRLQNMIGHVDGAVEKVREISSNLRPAMLDDLGFEATAEWFLGQCAGREGFNIRWHSEAEFGGRVKGEVATALFRILQECMTNIGRHSNASTVTIVYREQGDRAILEVRDNGAGFDPGKVRTSGFGLVGIRERVAMLNGDVTVESALGKGVRVRVALPLEDNTHD